MLNKRVSNKIFAIFLVVAISLLGSICMASANWSYMIDNSNALSKTTTGFGKRALESYGSTMVDGMYRAGVVVLLQQQDAEGDWISINAWDNYDSVAAVVDEVFAVPNGTYRLEVHHKAYAEDDTDYSDPLELFTSHSVIQTYK